MNESPRLVVLEIVRIGEIPYIGEVAITSLDLDDAPGPFAVVGSMLTASPCVVQCCRSLYALACMQQLGKYLTHGCM